MDRDELLKRVRMADEDEGKIYIEEKGHKWGIRLMMAMIAIVLIANKLSGKEIDNSILSVVFAGHVGIACADYWYSRRKVSLFSAIFSFAVLILVFYSYPL